MWIDKAGKRQYECLNVHVQSIRQIVKGADEMKWTTQIKNLNNTLSFSAIGPLTLLSRWAEGGWKKTRAHEETGEALSAESVSPVR